MKKIFAVILGVGIVVSLSGCQSTKKADDSNNNVTKSTKVSSSEEPEYFNESNNTFTYKFASVKIDKVEVTKGNDGDPNASYPLVKIRFTVTNKSDKAETAQSLVQSLVSFQQKSGDGVSVPLDFGSSSDYETDPSNLQSMIEPEAKISGYFPYKLKNTTDPIVVRYHTSYDVDMTSDNDKIIKTVEMPIK